MINRFKVEVPAGQLDMRLCVTSGQVFRWREVSPNQFVGVDGDYWYSISPTFEVESNGTLKEFSNLFRLDVTQEDIEREVVSRGPELAPYVHRLRGLRLMRPTGLVESMFCFLCTPNNHLTRITAMVRELGGYGEPLGGGAPEGLTRFPSIDRIASISEAELRAKGFGYRGGTIPSIARQVLAKPTGWLESLKAAPYQVAVDELTTLKGVGPKLADCIALFALHKMEAAPVDTHLWQACVREYFPEFKGKSLTDARYHQIGNFLRERFGPLTGIAHQYLFYDNLLRHRGQ